LLTLAEELHFGRTAERLRLTPSRVSQTLRELEHKLGAQLVHRTSRRVELTPDGAAFLRDVRPAYDELAAALHRAQGRASAIRGTLRLGLFSGPSGGPHLLALISAFEARHPGAKVDVAQVSWDDPFAQLRAGALDLVASWIPLEQADLVVGPVLSRQPRVLAVARAHPAAARERMSAEDLAGERLARFPGWPPELDESWTPTRTPAGAPIAAAPLQPGDRTPLGIAARVARGELVHLTVADAAPSVGALDIAFVPVDGLPPLRSALVWRRRAKDPRLREFVRVASDVVRAARSAARG
jgi:DNA-binding transcriptional LysR family regulator